MSMVTEFKEFINRGNVVDLAVAVVLGTAFGAVVTSFVDDVLMQIVAIIVGEPDFSALAIKLGENGEDGIIYYGNFLTVLVGFIIIAFAVFLVVKAINSMQSQRAQGETPAEEEPAPTPDQQLLMEIRDLLATRNTGGGTPQV
ncbi:MAG: large-conductance mechanosensitive channel protein MscL [Acidimicrobiia bacterium]|nr:large-conductance mechanosensitive channel protein MscL [Acidimicrobiia bacterium]